MNRVLTKWKFLNLAFLLCIMVFSFSFTAFAVQFEGISTLELQQLKKRLPDINSKNPSYSTLDKAIRYLMSLDTYASVSIYQTENGERKVVGVPLKKVGSIQVVGAKEFDEDDIVGVLGLKPGSKFDAGKVMSAGDALKEFYGKRGYFNTIIGFNFEENEGQNLKIIVNIKEREPCRISGFEFLTPNKDLSKRLQQNIRRFKGKLFSEENLISLEQSLEEFVKERHFLSSEILQKEANYNRNKTEVQLQYQVTDPYSYEVIMKGNQLKSTAEVLKGLNLDEFPRGVLDPAEELAKRAREFYTSNGFPHIHLQFKENVVESQFRKVIVLDISEGAKVYIKKMDIVGRISRPSDYYEDIIVENSSDLIADHLFVRQDIENGIKNLITELNNQGFLHAKSQSFRVEFSDKRDQAEITIFLDEGPLTTLTRVTFHGISAFQPNELIETMSIKANAPLRLNNLEESIENLRRFYFDRGFIEMRIENEGADVVKYDEKGLRAEVDFQIHEGPQVSVKTIFVEGNTFTKDYVVLREVGIEPGELLTLEKIEEGRRRLDKLGIFSRIDIRTLEANSAVAARTLIISVTERNPGVFKFGAGVTSKNQLTARGFTGVTYNNLGGTARAISVRGTLEQNLIETDIIEYELNFGYLEPFLLESSFRGRANYSRSEKIVSFLKDNPSTPTEEKLDIRATDKISFSVEKDITSRITLSWLAWGFDRIESYKLEGETDHNQIDVAYVGPSLDIDYRDNPFLPTTGTFTTFDAEYACPFLGSTQNIEFVRTQGAFTHYLPFFKSRVVWANSIRGGYENNLSNHKNSGIPDSFAFFLGDYSTIRGYSGSQLDRIPSSAEFTDATDQLIIPGESTFYLLKSELRFPLTSGPTWGGVLFYDAGEVTIQGYHFDDPFKQSIGAGLRINTPVGPISLDYGHKINDGGDITSKYEWHLSIGTF